MEIEETTRGWLPTEDGFNGKKEVGKSLEELFQDMRHLDGR